MRFRGEQDRSSGFSTVSNSTHQAVFSVTETGIIDIIPFYN
jgi:hypothetical protein